jgi:hypothetical protein
LSGAARGTLAKALVADSLEEQQGLPDFSWCNKPKREKYTKNYKIYQMATAYTY